MTENIGQKVSGKREKRSERKIKDKNVHKEIEEHHITTLRQYIPVEPSQDYNNNTGWLNVVKKESKI